MNSSCLLPWGESSKGRCQVEGQALSWLHLPYSTFPNPNIVTSEICVSKKKNKRNLGFISIFFKEWWNFLNHYFTFGRTVSSLRHVGFSLVVISGAALSCGFGLPVAPWLWSAGLLSAVVSGFLWLLGCDRWGCCQLWLPASCSSGCLWPSAGSGAPARRLWHVGLAAPQPVGCSQTAEWTCVPCLGRQDSQPLDHQGSL